MAKRSPKTPAPPLSATSQKWLSTVLDEYGIQDIGGITLAQQAAEALDRAAEARRLIAKHGLLIPDRFGALHSNPACAVCRDAESSYRGAIRMLGLDLEPVKPIGRPSGH